VRIAVVIPALDEAEEVEGAVASARDASGDEDIEQDGVEIVVVDGGSRDRTTDRARAAGARVVTSPPGRARQLDAGWRTTEGEVVLFLHADTRLPSGWAAAVRRSLADPRVAGGAFGFRFRAPARDLAWIELGARLRSRWARLPYGDQALFARREVLDAAGGVAQVPIAEDLDLVRAIRRRGRLVIVSLDAVTSGRRYRARGALRTWLRNAVALIAWRAGVDRDRLARWYRA
jgi:rSAM/selenodomain-associated transferase 2